MPALQNPRHERFAQAIFERMAKGKGEYSQAKAYLDAGYKAANGNTARACASRLLAFANGVAERIQELQRQTAKRKQVTIETIVDELDEARAIASSTAQASAMVSATSTKAKILGLSIERTEVGNPGDFSQTNDMESLVTKVILDENPNASITNEMKEAMAMELQRHARVTALIASGEVDALASVQG